jgi:ankyrin repeat protein
MSEVTALHEAVRNGDLPTIKRMLAARLLLEHGADVALLDSENDSIALWRRFSQATLEEWGETAELLRARGGEE